jgi:DNA modification methylase
MTLTKKEDIVGHQSSLLIHDDCLVAMNRIPDNSVDMILCDLPYG